MSFLISYLCITWGLVPLTDISLCYFGLFAIQTTNWKIDQWEKKMKYKIDYRSLVNRIAAIALPHNHQAMPYYIFWGRERKALNQLYLVSFLIIKMKTTRRNNEGFFLLKILSATCFLHQNSAPSYHPLRDRWKMLSKIIVEIKGGFIGSCVSFWVPHQRIAQAWEKGFPYAWCSYLFQCLLTFCCDHVIWWDQVGENLAHYEGLGGQLLLRSTNSYQGNGIFSILSEISRLI